MGRSGVQPTSQFVQGNWCNIKKTGFGEHPSANTGDSLLDAFVWVNPGGESNGTSDSSALRYDNTCSSSDSVIPAPEAGAWFQAYLEQLVQNANPAFVIVWDYILLYSVPKCTYVCILSTEYIHVREWKQDVVFAALYFFFCAVGTIIRKLNQKPFR